jgi:hypothetical protein
LFAAMRRALVIAGVMLAGLLALVPALATAASSPSREEAPLEEPEFFEAEELTFTLSVEGFAVDVVVEDNGIEETATLTISRGDLTSTYEVPAMLTGDSVSARFGTLGAFDLHFEPKKGARKCLGRLIFTGSFTFTGENDYVHVDADRAEGSRLGGEFFTCGSEDEEGFLEVDESVGLEAIAGSVKRGAGRQVTAEEWGPGGHRREVRVAASQVEETEGMRIARGALVHARRGAFRHNVYLDTATLKPPAPFTGWARLKPGRGHKGIWEGTLRLPGLDGTPIHLTGPAFRAHFVQERAVD